MVDPWQRRLQQRCQDGRWDGGQEGEEEDHRGAFKREKGCNRQPRALDALSPELKSVVRTLQ